MARPWSWLCTLRAAGCPYPHATLASGCGPALPGGIGYPQGSHERFPHCILHRFPLSQASPGARTSPISAEHPWLRPRLQVCPRKDSSPLACRIAGAAGSCSRRRADRTPPLRDRMCQIAARSVKHRWFGKVPRFSREKRAVCQRVRLARWLPGHPVANAAGSPGRSSCRPRRWLGCVCVRAMQSIFYSGRWDGAAYSCRRPIVRRAPKMRGLLRARQHLP